MKKSLSLITGALLLSSTAFAAFTTPEGYKPVKTWIGTEIAANFTNEAEDMVIVTQNDPSATIISNIRPYSGTELAANTTVTLKGGKTYALGYAVQKDATRSTFKLNDISGNFQIFYDNDYVSGPDDNWIIRDRYDDYLLTPAEDTEYTLTIGLVSLNVADRMIIYGVGIFEQTDGNDEPVIDPVDPEDPDEPVIDPVDPEDPDEPVIDPVDPEDPDEPVVDPVDPEDPDEPVIDPVDPEDPDEPVVDPEPVVVPNVEYIYEEGLEDGTVFTLESEVTITAVGSPEGAEESYVFVTDDYYNFLIRVEGELPEGYVNGAKISNARMVYSPIEYIDPNMGGYDMEDDVDDNMEVWAIYVPSAIMSPEDCPIAVAGAPVAAKPVEYMLDAEVYGYIALSNAYVSDEDEFLILFEDGEYYQIIPMNEEVANDIRSINANATSYLDIVNYFNLEGCFGIGEFGLALYATSASACATEAEITIGGESKFDTAQTIEITCDDENATIYYCVVKNSEEEAIRADFVEYTEPFVISGSCTVMAYARSIGYTDGQIVSKEFTDNSNTGIDSVSATENAENFNLQGIRVANPTNGIYIVRQNGKAVKVRIAE